MIFSTFFLCVKFGVKKTPTTTIQQHMQQYTHKWDKNDQSDLDKRHKKRQRKKTRDDKIRKADKFLELYEKWSLLLCVPLAALLAGPLVPVTLLSWRALNSDWANLSKKNRIIKCTFSPNFSQCTAPQVLAPNSSTPFHGFHHRFPFPFPSSPNSSTPFHGFPAARCHQLHLTVLLRPSEQSGPSKFWCCEKKWIKNLTSKRERKRQI